MSSLLIFNSSHLKSGKTITNVESSISTETMTFDFKDELESTKLSSNKCFIFGKPLNQLNDISNDSICSPFNSTRDKPSPSNIAIIENSYFADGECHIRIIESIRGKEVYVIQPTCPPVNENLIELLLTISAMKRISAKKSPQ